jgi:hypothetical protein
MKGPRAKKPKYNLVQGSPTQKLRDEGIPESTVRSLTECTRIQSFEMPKGSVGKYPCPYCEEGYVSFSIASNGHIHAACTNKCFMFMQ